MSFPVPSQPAFVGMPTSQSSLKLDDYQHLLDVTAKRVLWEQYNKKYHQELLYQRWASDTNNAKEMIHRLQIAVVCCKQTVQSLRALKFQFQFQFQSL